MSRTAVVDPLLITAVRVRIYSWKVESRGFRSVRTLTVAMCVQVVFLLVGCQAPTPPSVSAELTGTVLSVDPSCVRRIRGVSELRRETYFGLCSHGTRFDEQCRSRERYRYLIEDLGVTFGRKLGVVYPATRWGKVVREDPDRPGHADLDYLRETCDPARSSWRFRRDMGGRLEVAAHGNHNGFPEFLGTWSTQEAAKAKKPEHIPANLDAAAELAAAVLKHNYTDFDRPAFYELVNEPHWSFPDEPEFQQWHLKTMAAVHAAAPDVRVGGPCLSVSYFYKKQFGAFNGLKAFIDGTDCSLDFYSFHSYDYLGEKDGDFNGGRVTSGMPLEAVIDLIPNYTVNAHGKEVDIVLSEHGAYGANDLVEKLARKHFPGEGFDWEMKKRSIDDFNMVSGVLANTLVFMDHPHIVRKAVPFILLQSMGWDPTYYATLYTPRNFTDKNDWVPSQKVLFYKLMRDVRGQRVVAHSPDPDLQLRAFADGRTVYTIINNLSTKPETISLAMPAPRSLTVRRVGRNPDFTPYYREERVPSPAGIRIGGREALVLVANYRRLRSMKAVDEIPCYGDRIAARVDGKADFTVDVPDSRRLAYADLRVGISRPSAAGRAVAIRLNGEGLPVQDEDAAERIDNGSEYATCKIIRLAPAQVRARNTVTVSFPEGGEGAVGAVVIRAAYRK